MLTGGGGYGTLCLKATQIKGIAVLTKLAYKGKATERQGTAGNMIGLGTVVNTAAIAAAGFAGHSFGRVFDEEKQRSLNRVCGVCVLFIGIAGAMEGMLKLSGGALSSARSMFVVLSLALGTVLGELLRIEDGFERFGEWLKRKTGNAKDARFVEAFVTASLTVSIGAMAVVGSIEDGIEGDASTLMVKAVLDFIIIAVMSSALGKGAAFSAIPVFFFEGLMTVLARLLAPLMTDAALANLSLVGSILIFCVGVNLIWGKTLRVANMLPSIVLAVAAAFLPAL